MKIIFAIAQKENRIFRRNLSLFPLILNTSKSSLRTQLQGSVHTDADFLGLCTHSCRASIYYPNPLLRLTDALKLSSSKTHYNSDPKKLATSTHRASLYLYLSMDHDPWAGRLTYISLHYFWAEYPLTQIITTYALRIPRSLYPIFTQNFGLCAL